MRDGKGNFYKNLNLDKPTRKLIRWYREVKYSIDRDLGLKKTKYDREADARRN